MPTNTLKEMDRAELVNLKRLAYILNPDFASIFEKRSHYVSLRATAKQSPGV